MSRDEGFAIADMSSSWLDDEKFARLAREYPGQHLWGVAGYGAVVAASWRWGKRMKVGDSLPAWLHFNADGVAALMAVRLLDRTSRVPVRTWREWFGPAAKRRKNSRERWARANEKRSTTANPEHKVPRGNRAVTASTVRPSVRPSYTTKEGERDRLLHEARAGLSLVASGGLVDRGSEAG